MTLGNLFGLSLLISTLVTAIPALLSYKRTGDLLHPGVLFGGLFFLYYPSYAASVFLLEMAPAFPSARALPTAELKSIYTVSLLLISVGIAAFYVGVVRGQLQNKRYFPHPSHRELRPGFLLLVWVGAICIYYGRLNGILSRGNMVFTLLSQFHHYAISVLVINYSSQQKWAKYRWIIALLILADIVLISVSGFRLTQILILGVLTIVAYHYHGPGLTLRQAGGGVALVTVLFPMSEIVEELQKGEPLAAAISIGGGHIKAYAAAFFNRFIGVEALGMIIARTPEEVPYQYGETLALTFVSLIPRAIWPGKPSIIRCRVNNMYFSGRGVDAGTCAAMTVPGELFWNFGWVGVILGLFVFGYFVGFLYQWYRSGSQPWVATLIYGIILVTMIQFESGVAQLVSGAFKEVIFLSVFVFLVSMANDTEPVISEERQKTILENSIMYQIYGKFRTAWGGSKTRSVALRLLGLKVKRKNTEASN